MKNPIGFEQPSRLPLHKIEQVAAGYILRTIFNQLGRYHERRTCTHRVDLSRRRIDLNDGARRCQPQGQLELLGQFRANFELGHRGLKALARRLDLILAERKRLARPKTFSGGLEREA
jgi:hypothetical protein